MCVFLFVFFIYRTVIILGVFGGTSTPAVLHPFFRAENGRSFRFYAHVHVQSVHIDYFVFRDTVTQSVIGTGTDSYCKSTTNEYVATKFRINLHRLYFKRFHVFLARIFVKYFADKHVIFPS